MGGREDTTSLANSLREYCPNFNNLKIVLRNKVEDRIETLIRTCSIPPSSQAVETNPSSGLVTLSIRLQDIDESLVSAILAQAGTLENLTIEDYGRDHSNVQEVSRLLVGCRRLRNFALSLENGTASSRVMLDMLRSHAWGCSNLERSDLVFRDTRVCGEARPAVEETDRDPSRHVHGESPEEESEGGSIITVAATEDTSAETSFMDWLSHPPSFGLAPQHNFSVDRGIFRELFEIVEHLQAISWRGMVYSRTRSPPK
ncbi:hypothetical protein BGX29_011704, partial [Mortierella sp. GBA35]